MNSKFSATTSPSTAPQSPDETPQHGCILAPRRQAAPTPSPRGASTSPGNRRSPRLAGRSLLQLATSSRGGARDNSGSRLVSLTATRRHPDDTPTAWSINLSAGRPDYDSDLQSDVVDETKADERKDGDETKGDDTAVRSRPE